MVKKIEAMRKFIGKGKDIRPFSHLAPLPGIRYRAAIASEDFIYFASSRQKAAYDELFEALND
ncbi:disease resistance protein (CC-NBS-LRR class) family protein, partial [Trifolium medium]|nr:disease resistance protein (CC-NBS-LRR class) family protein [Trifolium medium]